jgi:flagellar biosynthesis/type III secretory pathway protein FliH
MSRGLPKEARRLSRHDIVQGQARVFGDGDAGASLQTQADAEEHQFGFEQGYRDGLRQARAELEEAASRARDDWERKAQAALDDARESLRIERERLASVADALGEALEEDRRWAESAAAEMAYRAILHVLGDKAADRSLVQALCAQARRELDGELVSVRVAIADAAALMDLPGGVSIVADDALVPGSCVLESRRGRFDAGLEMRLEQLRRALIDALQADKERA